MFTISYVAGDAASRLPQRPNCLTIKTLKIVDRVEFRDCNTKLVSDRICEQLKLAETIGAA